MISTRNGVVFLHKRPGETSFQCLTPVKKKLNTRKVGHTGVLDKFAEGLLIVFSGRFTKFVDYVTAQDKVYEAEITFGKTTDTLDPNGEIVKECSVPEYLLIEDAVEQFRGPIKQRPPIYSRISVGGKRAYKEALKGNAVDIPERDITIYDFSLLEWKAPCLNARIHCSKGTYIRSLARDLGKATESCAYVTQLKRTAIGCVGLDKAVYGSDFDPEKHLITSAAEIAELVGLPVLQIKAAKLKDFRLGKIPEHDWFENQLSVERKTHLVVLNNAIAGAVHFSKERYYFDFVVGEDNAGK